MITTGQTIILPEPWTRSIDRIRGSAVAVLAFADLVEEGFLRLGQHRFAFGNDSRFDLLNLSF